MSQRQTQDGALPTGTSLLRVGLAATDAALRIKRAGRAAQKLSTLTRTDPQITHTATVQRAIELITELGYLGENDPGSAIQVASNALAVVEDLPPGPWSLVAETQAELTRGEALLALGDLARAEGCADKAARDLALPLPDHALARRLHPGRLALTGQCAMVRGDVELATRSFRQALELCHEHEGLQQLVLARLAQAMLAVGEHDLGLSYVDRALASETMPGSEVSRARLHGIRAELLLEAGDLPGALAASETAAELVTHAGLDPAEHERRAATVRAAMGDPDNPSDLARLAEDEERDTGAPSLATVLALATAHLRAGDPRSAVSVLAPYAPVRSLPPTHRDAVYDVLAAAAEQDGDESTALALLKEQREVARADARSGMVERTRTLAEAHQVDLLRADLDLARRREQELSLLVRQRTAELTWRSAHDELTGLYSREELLRRLRAPVGPAVHRTVLYLDLDRFKVVNDAHGHDVGDVLLSVVGRRLETAVLGLSGSTCVARLGGDEFCVLVDTDTPVEPVGLARSLADELGAPVDLPSLGRVSPEISIGVAQAAPQSPRPVGDTDLDLLRDADVALHRSKSEGGRGIYVFGQADRAQAVHRFQVEHRVRSAIEEGRIQPVYDPIVDLRTGQVVGVEALCRMQEGDRLVRAAEFIEIAEESALIDSIGRIITRASIHDLAASGRPLFVAINLGPRELRRPGLVDDLRRQTETAGVPLDRLVVEVTERSFVDVASTEAGVLRELDAAGVSLAIDDFSTGHSSMVHLSWMPVQILKIDRSLVVRTTHSQADRTLVSAVISMAQTLGLRVVAEGIETAEVGWVVRELGCDLAQGHLFDEYGALDTIPDAFDLEALLRP